MSEEEVFFGSLIALAIIAWFIGVRFIRWMGRKRG